MARGEAECVCAVTTRQQVSTAATYDEVIAVTAVDRVRATPPKQNVVASVTIDLIAAASTIDQIPTLSPSAAQVRRVQAIGFLTEANDLEPQAVELLMALEEWERDREDARGRRRVARQPLHLQRTGKGVVVGLATLGLLVAVLWWQNGSEPVTHSTPGMDTAGESATQMSVGE